MTLTFSSQAIRDAARRAIDNHERVVVEYNRRVDEFKVKRRADWIAEQTPRMKELRNHLTAAFRTSGIVTGADVADILGVDRRVEIGTAFYDEPSAWEINNAVETPDHYRASVDGYPGLIDLLDAHEGDTITDRQLISLGYKHLTELFRDAVKAGAAE